MTRRKVFDPATAPRAFWARDEVQVALARRDMADLFRAYLQEFPECTQTQLALLTEHDRSDVSNWLRGTRQAQVSDIDVLARIAEGLQMPDRARVLMGLAPANARYSSIGATAPHADQRPPTRAGADGRARLAICGSRSPGADTRVIDAAIPALARLVVVQGLAVNHGPVGVGIEVVTHVADRFRPPDLQDAVARFGRRNVVADADYVLVVGGGAGTRDEVDLAISMGKCVVPLRVSGGTACAIYDRMAGDERLRHWIPAAAFTALGRSRVELSADIHDVEQVVERDVTTIGGVIRAALGDRRD